MKLLIMLLLGLGLTFGISKEDQKVPGKDEILLDLHTRDLTNELVSNAIDLFQHIKTH